MPRFGKDFKMFKRIVPSLYLDITDVLMYGMYSWYDFASINICRIQVLVKPKWLVG